MSHDPPVDARAQWRSNERALDRLRDLQQKHDERDRGVRLFWCGAILFVGANLMHLAPLAVVAQNRSAVNAIAGAGLILCVWNYGSVRRGLEQLPPPEEAARIRAAGSRPEPLWR